MAKRKTDEQKIVELFMEASKADCVRYLGIGKSIVATRFPADKREIKTKVAVQS